MRILVVEDNEDIREGVVGLLRDQGYEVVEASDGAEGLQLLRTRKHVDLVVLDLMMPVMNGATFRWQQRWDASIAAVPVLVLSSVRDGNKSAELLGAAGYLPKPFAPEALLAAVSRVGAAARAARRRRERSAQ